MRIATAYSSTVDQSQTQALQRAPRFPHRTPSSCGEAACTVFKGPWQLLFEHLANISQHNWLLHSAARSEIAPKRAGIVRHRPGDTGAQRQQPHQGGPRSGSRLGPKGAPRHFGASGLTRTLCDAQALVSAVVLPCTVLM